MWYVLPCLFFGIGGAFFLYYREKQYGYNLLQKMGLASLRFLGLSLVALLLLGFLFRHQNEIIEKPLIVVAYDASRSAEQDGILDSYNSLSSKVEKLSDKFRIVELGFGSEIIDEIPNSFSDIYTDFSQLESAVKTRFGHTNLGALLLVSDGIATKGSNLFNAFDDLGIPIFPIVIGDTNSYIDLSISSISKNSKAYQGNRFPIEVFVNAKECKSEKISLSLFDNGKKVATEEFAATTEDLMKKILFSPLADSLGLHKYEVRIDVINGEKNLRNNSSIFFVEVLEEKQKIMIVAAAPHPDVAAMKSAIKNQDDFLLSYSFEPLKIEHPEQYNLIVLHQLPTSSPEVALWIEKLKSQNIPLLFVLGQKSNINRFNSLNVGVEIVQPSLTFVEAQAYYNSGFSLFSIPKSGVEFLSNVPPLSAPFGNYKYPPASRVLLFQKNGSIVTENPLISFYRDDSHKFGLISGEGLWRWRLYDFQKNSNHNAFDAVVLKIMQFMVHQRETSPFRVSVPLLIDEGEELLISAELFNENGEKQNESLVELSIYDSLNREYDYLFSPYLDSYRLNVGVLSSGDYSWRAETELAGEKYQRSGNFSVQTVDVEFLKTNPEVSQLQRVASNSNGELFWLDNLDGLPKDLLNLKNAKPVVYQQYFFSKPIDNIWLLIIIITIFSLEWFLRKRFGGL